MRISVNLATRPFVELRSFFARLRVIMAALAVLAIGLFVVMHFERAKLLVAEEQMNAVKRRTVTAQEEKLRNEGRMRQPANSAVLDRAHFLNALFLGKSFSWTAVMMDLETVLPTGVQVTAIEPQVTADGDVIIRLRVSGDRDRAVQLVRNLERSKRFLTPRLANENAHKNDQSLTTAASAVGGADVEFDILANYNPLPVTGVNAADYRKGPATDGGTTILGGPRSEPEVRDKRLKWAGKQAGKLQTDDGVVLKPYVPAGGVR